jgi:hypothetical protein
MTAAYVDDRQAAVAESNPVVEVDTSIVGTPVLEGLAHLEQRVGIDRSINSRRNNNAANSAH